MEKNHLKSSTIRRFHKIGGAVDYNFFHVADFDTGVALQAISKSIPKVDMAQLNKTYCKPIEENSFFGSWYDQKTGALIKKGTWTLENGSVISDPAFSALPPSNIIGGISSIPDIDQSGNYAYAFCNPPYGLLAKPYTVQELFGKINEIIFPPGCETEILDWCHCDLDKVSNYFAAGKEWWGMFLFTLYTRDRGQLTVISASATD